MQKLVHKKKPLQPYNYSPSLVVGLMLSEVTQHKKGVNISGLLGLLAIVIHYTRSSSKGQPVFFYLQHSHRGQRPWFLAWRLCRSFVSDIAVARFSCFSLVMFHVQNTARYPSRVPSVATEEMSTVKMKWTSWRVFHRDLWTLLARCAGHCKFQLVANRHCFTVRFHCTEYCVLLGVFVALKRMCIINRFIHVQPTTTVWQW